VQLLLAEDDELLGDGIHAALSRAGHSVDWVRDGRAALAALAQPFDVILLDLGLPRVDGMDVLRRVRRSGVTTPVLVLSARDTPAERVTGLDAGADDYLIKPFEVEELLARVRALQRRSRAGVARPLDHGRLHLDPAMQTVTYDGREVPLQRREYMLLHKLLENAGQVFTRAQLEESLYGWDASVESNAVDVHIHNLRKKLYPGLIRTIRGVGYAIDRIGDVVSTE
jgi:two-component system response regulator QseB